ncbi:MAG TPA: haloacid dehalogenase type II [Roseiarcus sp.]|nr:haloacid dehalogenase type II [Roseiarcus sp.]
MSLSDFEALSFDCYGTLIDWETGIIEALKPLSERAKRNLTRNQILEAHARHESSQQRQTPTMRYRDLLSIVYKRLAEEWSLAPTHEECVEYGRSVGSWPAFSDSAAALQYLKKRFKLAILSNVDNESFARSNKRLGVEFDAVYTAEDVGAYKPSARNFEYMLEKLAGLGIARGKLLHTAESLFHDHRPANDFKLKSCWIYRRHADEGFGATMHPGEAPKVDFKFNSMGDLVKAHQAEAERSGARNAIGRSA